MDDLQVGDERGSPGAATQPRGGRAPWRSRLRRHQWTPIERAGVIAALAIVMGSLFVTTYSLALGDPVPRHIDAALVGDPKTDAATVKAVQGVAENSLDFTEFKSTAAALHAIDVERLQDRYARWRRETWCRNEMGDKQSHFKPAEQFRTKRSTNV